MKEKIISWATTIIGIGLVVMFAIIYFQSDEKSLIQFCGGLIAGLILMWFRGEWAVQLWNVCLDAIKARTRSKEKKHSKNHPENED